MKRLYLGISLITAFSIGVIASNLINFNKCLVQNIKLQGLAVIENQNRLYY